VKFGVSCREMRAKPSSAPASAVVHGRPPHAGAQRRWPCILVWTLPLLLFSLHHGRACVAAGRSSAPSAPATPLSFLCVAGSPMSGALGARQGGRDGRAHVALLPRGRRRPPSRCIAGGWTAGGFLGGASAPVEYISECSVAARVPLGRCQPLWLSWCGGVVSCTGRSGLFKPTRRALVDESFPFSSPVTGVVRALVLLTVAGIVGGGVPALSGNYFAFTIARAPSTAFPPPPVPATTQTGRP